MLQTKSINDLSSETLLKIFEYSSDAELRCFRLVNRKWNHVYQVHMLDKAVTLYLSDEAILMEAQHLMRSNQMWTKLVLSNLETQLQMDDKDPVFLNRFWIRLGQNIEDLTIHSLHKIFSHNWLMALKYSKHVQRLCIRIAPENISHNRKSIEGIEELTREIVKYYYPACKFPILRKIELEIFDDRVTTEYLKFLNKTVTVTNLTSLKICSRYFSYCSSNCTLALELANLIRSNAGTLMELKIIGFQPTILSRLTDIENLSLDLFEWDCSDINLPDFTIDFLRTQVDLRKLFFTINHGEEIVTLARLSKLEYLYIVICSEGNFDEIVISMEILNNFPKLKYFKICLYSEKETVPCKLEFSSNMNTNSNLETLSLKLNEGVNTEVINSLLHNIKTIFQNLQSLCIDVTSEELPLIFSNLQGLEELQLSVFNVDLDTPVALRELWSPGVLPEYPNLFELISGMSALKYFKLSCNSDIINDDTLIRHFKLGKLKTLTLMNCGQYITDKGVLGLISNCPTLKSLELHNFHNISNECVTYLQDKLDRFDITFTLNNYNN